MGFFFPWYHIPSLLRLLSIANWKWVLWKYSPAQLTLLFHTIPMAQQNFSLCHIFITLFIKVVLSDHQQKSWFALNSIVLILIAWKHLLFCFRKCSHFKFYIAKLSSSDDDFNIFSSTEIPFSQQTDLLFERVSLKIHRFVNFSSELPSEPCIPWRFVLWPCIFHI